MKCSHLNLKLEILVNIVILPDFKYLVLSKYSFENPGFKEKLGVEFLQIGKLKKYEMKNEY
jgi:hypothetical protein